MATASTDVPLVVVIGDLHAGSAFAPCPGSIEVDDGLTVMASRAQTWLRRCWDHFRNDFVPAVVRRRKFILVVTGDCIEGVHHDEEELVWRSEPIHSEIAINLLRPLAKRAEVVYAVRGTRCHTKGWDNKIAEEIGAVQCEQAGLFAPDSLDISVRKCLTSFRHHTTTAGRRAGQATKLAAQLVEEQVGAAGSLTPIPRVIVRSHCHVFGSYTDGDGLSITTPPWKVMDRHSHNVVGPAERTQKVGGVVLDYSACVDPLDLPSVHSKLYRPTA